MHKEQRKRKAQTAIYRLAHLRQIISPELVWRVAVWVAWTEILKKPDQTTIPVGIIREPNKNRINFKLSGRHWEGKIYISSNFQVLRGAKSWDMQIHVIRVEGHPTYQFRWKIQFWVDCSQAQYRHMNICREIVYSRTKRLIKWAAMMWGERCIIGRAMSCSLRKS